MIIDCHMHFGPALRHFCDEIGPVLKINTVGDLLRVMDDSRIEIAVICPPRWIGGDFFDPTYEKANQAIAEACRAHPDRLIGFARVNPNWGAKAVEEVRRCFGQYGLKGLKLDPEWDSFFATNKRLVHPLLDVAIEYKVPVMFYAGYYPAEPALLIQLAMDYAPHPIIMGHMGGRLTSDAVIAARRATNLILEISGSLYSFSGVIKALGADRFIFGSNCPFEFPKVQLEKFQRTPNVSSSERIQILSGNAVKLFGLRVPAS